MIAGRREIESFFMQEVDRDKIVLVGMGEAAVGGARRERAEMACERPPFARWGFGESASADAYYAALYAARAALSEADHHARTHAGVWNLFFQSFVEPGRFERGLYAEARRAERVRLDAHYEAGEVSLEDAAEVVGTAERFVAAVERTLSE